MNTLSVCFLISQRRVKIFNKFIIIVTSLLRLDVVTSTKNMSC